MGSVNSSVSVSLPFGDVDTDKDSFMNWKEFDCLLETVAAVPCRYGHVWQDRLWSKWNSMELPGARQVVFAVQ